jgi:hypothetical protein
MPGASLGELVERIAEEFVERNDPLLKAERGHRSQVSRDEAKSQNDLRSASGTATSPRATKMVARRNAKSTAMGEVNKTSGVSRPRMVSESVKREVIRRSGGQCEYSFGDRRCSSRYQLEVDHIIPKAKGGSDETQNLRCLCRNHNQMMAEREFGAGFMASKRAACLESAVLRG